MYPKQISVSLVSKLWIYILNLTSSAPILTYICLCGSGSLFAIRIQEAPEYGSNTDPDPQHCFQQTAAASVKVNPNMLFLYWSYFLLISALFLGLITYNFLLKTTLS